MYSRLALKELPSLLFSFIETASNGATTCVTPLAFQEESPSTAPNLASAEWHREITSFAFRHRLSFPIKICNEKKQLLKIAYISKLRTKLSINEYLYI